MHFHVENYDHETIFSLTLKEDTLRGSSLRQYVNSLEPLKGEKEMHFFDFSHYSDQVEHEGMLWYGDGERFFLEMFGDNQDPSGDNFYQGVVDEAIKLMHGQMYHVDFELLSVMDTRLMALNHYNVMMTLRGKYNRMLIFSISEGMAGRIAAKMLEEPITMAERKALERAAVSELSNMIVGLSLKHMVSKETMRMSVPMCFEAPQGQLIWTSKPVRVAMCAGCGEAFKIYGVNFY